MIYRKQCSRCGEDLCFSEGDPCDNCAIFPPEPDTIPRADVADALTALLANVMAHPLEHVYAVSQIRATIAALGLDAASNGE